MRRVDGPGNTVFGAKLEIDRLGQRGEGIARYNGRAVYVPHALPGETVLANIDGDRGALNMVEHASRDRVEPPCRYYGGCGGCALQVLAPEAYMDWKRGLVSDALVHAGIDAPVADIVPAHGDGRRRVSLHARYRPAIRGDAVLVGFMRARSHEVVAIEDCPVLSPSLDAALPAAGKIAVALASVAKPLDLLITATGTGLDVDLRGAGPLPDPARLALSRLAERLDLARLSNHGEVVIERRAPELSIGGVVLKPPPGAFLQATQAGEDTLAGLVQEAAQGARRIADLFSGSGTFALRLAAGARVHAVEHDGAALQALSRAANFATGLKAVTIEQRDLFRRPLAQAQLQDFDCVVLDPPRAGAEAQSRELAPSNVPLVVSVSCNAQTFARDARILIDGGYVLEWVTPVDQFLHSPHVEIVGVFRKIAPRKTRRRLLG